MINLGLPLFDYLCNSLLHCYKPNLAVGEQNLQLPGFDANTPTSVLSWWQLSILSVDYAAAKIVLSHY